MKPFISIITVNYNQVQVTCELLASIRKLNYEDVEVIVVDNGSTEDPRVIENLYPEVNLIMSDRNLGFAGGNNLGIKVASGDYLFFVNNDTELNPDILEHMIARFEMDNDIGMVSPKIKYHSQPELIQYAGYTEINSSTGRNRTVGYKEKDNGQYDMARATYYGHGAAMMIKREILKDVGMMPEDFFLYYEELDWCEQIKRTGYKIYYEPKAEIYHKESISVGKISPLKTYYMTRNRILFMKRNASWSNFLIFIFFFTFFSVPKSLLMYSLKREKEHLKAFTNGIHWHFTSKKEKVDMTAQTTPLLSSN
jgi:GT2 family glycosyltransferase